MHLPYSRETSSHAFKPTPASPSDVPAVSFFLTRSCWPRRRPVTDGLETMRVSHIAGAWASSMF
ncbi:hypothetical protein BofuT4_uP045630.1 [Botrytis cinerea T4]|uniref:Uncharacterized protein n=1 Tax=Botryotinia fuckeliana (strain T4) TaxID=999810 RepID=G2XYK8_BOTF4|nr:hypothetical protein BofuT4_uP045630.1 [Botrytis cinerea T4]